MSTDFVGTILDHLARGGERAVVTEVHGSELRPTSCRELLDLIARQRARLRQSGVRPGDRVALLAPNSAQWIGADLAILAEGAICVPFYARQSLPEIVAMAKDADVALVVASDPLSLRKTWPEAPIVDLDLPLVSGPTLVEENQSSGIDPIPSSVIVGKREEGSEGEIATIVYTSGTSGEPKGAMISRAGVDHVLAATTESLARMMGTTDVGAERVFHYLPFCFMGSRIVLWTCLYRGGGIYVSTNLENLAEELRAVRPHWMLNVPALLERIRKGVEDGIAKQPWPVRALHRRAMKGDAWAVSVARRLVWQKVRAKIGPDLVALICGSAPLRKETQDWFGLLGIPVYQVYGLTETTAIVTMDEPGKSTPGRVGLAIPGCELRITDEGELCVRGPNVFPGYFRKPEATARAMDGDWLRTGDRVELDATGSLAVLGRVSSVLVPESGHNVVPEPIEERLLAALPGAEHAVVVGHARPFLSALVTGDVASADLARAVETVNAELPHYRRLRKYALLGERFTIESGLLTANQKLKRRAIEERFRDQVEELYR